MNSWDAEHTTAFIIKAHALFSVTLLFSECIRSDACSVNSVLCSVTPNVFNEYSSLNVFRVGIGRLCRVNNFPQCRAPNVFGEHSSFQADFVQWTRSDSDTEHVHYTRRDTAEWRHNNSLLSLLSDVQIIERFSPKPRRFVEASFDVVSASLPRPLVLTPLCLRAM